MARRSRSRSRSSRINRHAYATEMIAARTEDSLLDLVRAQIQPFVLVLDGVQDPHNLGACLRSADAAGVHAVVAPRHRAVALTETVIQVACGAAQTTPFFQATNIPRMLEDLKKAGLWVVGTGDDSSDSIYDLDLRGSLALVMGAEGEGLRRLTRQRCDALGKIPMHGNVECLNVSVATGVCLFEAVRQRELSRA